MTHCTEAIWGVLSLMVVTSLGGSSEDVGLLPRFVKDVPNITVTVGRDALLPCTVEQLKGFKVAWVQVDTQTILTIHKQVITRNPRIALLHNDHRSWHLELKNVKENDSGWYMCQVNTDPMRFRQGYVDVVVPPDIIDKDSSGDITVREGQDVVLTCRAKGHPPPSILWRREDNRDIILHSNQRGRSAGVTYQGASEPSGRSNDEDVKTPVGAYRGSTGEDVLGRGATRLERPGTTATDREQDEKGSHRGWAEGLGSSMKVVKGENLTLTKVSRLQMGSYLCIASNGVPPSISKRAHLRVQFPPMTWVPQQLEGAYVGQEMTIECRTEAFPKSINYWTGPAGEMIVPGPKFEPLVAETSYKVFMRLRIRNVEPQDFGTYHCVAKNSLGETDGNIRVYEIESPKARVQGEVTEAGGEAKEAADGHSTPTPPYKQEGGKFKTGQSAKGVNEVTDEHDPSKAYGGREHEKGHSAIYEYPLEGLLDFETSGAAVCSRSSAFLVVLVVVAAVVVAAVVVQAGERLQKEGVW